MITMKIKSRNDKSVRNLLIIIAVLTIFPIFFATTEEAKSEKWVEHRMVVTTQLPAREAPMPLEAFEIPERIKPSTLKIQSVFTTLQSPIADEVPYIYNEAEKRGLNPELVLAIMAKESGWGKYCYMGNCFGYGATDSGNISKWFPGDFRIATEMILDSYATYYRVDTAEEMASRGYNFHAEWVEGVNIILSYWN